MTKVDLLHNLRMKFNELSLREYLIVEETTNELEQENNKLLDVINNQDVKIADLEQQIEKMKWHKVADRDLPKVGQKCYFIYSNVYGEDSKISFSKSHINILTGVYAFILDEETGEETTETCFYDDINDDEIDLQEVYAWKEIVLPELPKESK